MDRLYRENILSARSQFECKKKLKTNFVKRSDIEPHKSTRQKLFERNNRFVSWKMFDVHWTFKQPM